MQLHNKVENYNTHKKIQVRSKEEKIIFEKG